ncbi:putative amidohydrolase [Haloactinopolyspora alba]|uniref:Putative amidohydrolase n=1 Tax=Haloactinopolyspora alba TaxID=648780 RepID=A0A2P8E707_9ACTN|nr:carbon-nitrogen hydrolase family protein [Haloactinopolyspora alba]PSL05207.1 putative amidohydrolase [Haloactinopolyspora alba]
MMRVALTQLAADVDAERNLDTVRRLTTDVEADLIVLPEATMHDFGDPSTPLGPPAQALDGPFVTALAALAREHAATVVGGMFERSDDPERPYNTLVALGPDGTLVATYRKAHLYDSFGYRESDRLLAGAPVPVVLTVGDVTIGLLTCYDLRFPEQARALVDAGADALVVPAAWVRGPLKEDHWETLLRARAMENTVYVAAAAQCGRKYCGRSMLVDPLGVAVAAAGADESSTQARLDPAQIAAARERNPALHHRRAWPVAPARPADGARDPS